MRVGIRGLLASLESFLRFLNLSLIALAQPARFFSCVAKKKNPKRRRTSTAFFLSLSKNFVRYGNSGVPPSNSHSLKYPKFLLKLKRGSKDLKNQKRFQQRWIITKKFLTPLTADKKSLLVN